MRGTGTPRARLLQPRVHERYGYMKDYSRMHLLADQNPRTCGIYEAVLIRAFLKHAEIDNVKDGDDNLQNVSPH